jgi:Asp-tRNA(Asn)/Glu-tRNA(Gln) amidotransferase A subunit family amidase
LRRNLAVPTAHFYPQRATAHAPFCSQINEALMLKALELAARIEAGNLTPLQVISACAEAIGTREAEIGAFVTLNLENARREAESAAAMPTGLPLRGIPVGVKDIFDTAALPTSYGSPIYAGYQPPADAALVCEIRRAGGVVLGKTVTTEFAFMHPGRTRNPCNPHHTPGGSSSGSAAAVAAGMIPLAIGSQTGGSVIRPAAYCGIAGFKPSYALLPTVGMKCFSWHLDTAGIFAARIADAAFAAAALTGRDLRVDKQTPAAPRLGLVRMHIWNDASEAMRGAVETAARAAQSAGGSVCELELPPLLKEAFEAHPVIQAYQAYRALAFEYDNCREQLSAPLRAHLKEGSTIDHQVYDAARSVAKRARHALSDLMTDIDAILTPSAPGAAPEGLGSTGAPIFNRLWTLMGTPCINVPGLHDAAQLPLGVQIVGRFGRDRAALETALFLESAIKRFGRS